jgi:hypothetical protein
MEINTNCYHFFDKFMYQSSFTLSVPVAAQSNAWICSRSLTGIASSSTIGCMNVCFSCCMALCERPITRPGKSSRMCCVCMLVTLKPEVSGGLGLILLSSCRKRCVLYKLKHKIKHPYN